jgi:hypothetical protein
MLRLRIVVALCAALLLSLAVPGVAMAEEPDVISSPTIVSAVVDMKTGVATVTISVTCLMDVGYQVRGEGSLSQSYGSGRFAFDRQGGFGGSTCQAGEVLTFPVRFPPRFAGSWRHLSCPAAWPPTTLKPLVRQPLCCIPPDGGCRVRP